MDSKNLKNRLNSKLKDNGSRPTEKKEDTVPVTQPPTPVESNYVALTNNALEIINENLKNQPLSPALFDVVKSPSGGTTVFTVPGLSGDEVEKELQGIILGYDTPRAYWDTPDPVEGTPPVCFSRDSVVSYEGKPCKLCQFNDFGSKNGETGAKACKESVSVYLLRQDSILPIVVRIPVSSKLLFLKYTTRLISNLTPLSGVVTKIALGKATNKTGQPYALYNFEAVSVLSSEEASSAKSFGAKFMEMLNAAGMEPAIAEVG